MDFIRETTDNKSTFSDHEQLGFAVICMLMHKNYSLFQIKTLQLWTWQAIQHRQIKFLFNHLGEPICYVTWAFPETETVQRLLNDPSFLFHISEWDEGGDLLIVDFCCLPGSGKYCIEHLKENIFSKHPRVSWRDRSGKRLLTWTNTSYAPSNSLQNLRPS